MHISICLWYVCPNIIHSAHIMLPVCMFSGVPIWQCTHLTAEPSLQATKVNIESSFMILGLSIIVWFLRIEDDKMTREKNPPKPVFIFRWPREGWRLGLALEESGTKSFNPNWNVKIAYWQDIREIGLNILEVKFDDFKIFSGIL